MKFPAFQHHFADSLDHAVTLLTEYGDDAKVLAGGQSLFPVMALRLSHPDHLIDIGRIGDASTAISVTPDGSTVIGVACRHSTAENSAELAEHQPLVHAAMPWIGHRAVRSRGTICGSIAHGDPAAELPAVSLALDAQMVIDGPGERRQVPASEFFLGTFETAVQPDEVLAEICIPPTQPGTGWAFEEISRRHGDYAVVGMATIVVLSATERQAIERAAIALFAVSGVPIRLTEVETLLAGATPSAELFDAAAELVAKLLDPPADLHGTAQYRVHLGRLLARRTLALAAERAGFAA